MSIVYRSAPIHLNLQHLTPRPTFKIHTPISTAIHNTIEMTTEMIIEMKIIEIRDIKVNIKIIIKTHMTRTIAELATKTKIGINIDINTEMTAII